MHCLNKKNTFIVCILLNDCPPPLNLCDSWDCGVKCSVLRKTESVYIAPPHFWRKKNLVWSRFPNHVPNFTQAGVIQLAFRTKVPIQIRIFPFPIFEKSSMQNPRKNLIRHGVQVIEFYFWESWVESSKTKWKSCKIYLWYNFPTYICAYLIRKAEAI